MIRNSYHKDFEEKYDGIKEMKSKIIENLAKENAQLFAVVEYRKSKGVVTTTCKLDGGNAQLQGCMDD